MSQEKQTEMFPLSDIVEGALVPQNVADALDGDEARGRYTAARLREKKPQLFNAVSAMLGCGMALSDIAERCSLSFYTVAAVAEIAAGDIAATKAKLAKKMFVNSEAIQAKILEAAANLDVSEATSANIYQLALASSVLADKANLFSGGITERIGVKDEDEYVNPDDFLAKLSQAKAKESATDAEFEQ
ncbi:MAG: hypothetical protein IJI37_05870 [Opitutales bacterium]|nr:hypothetical protein [Opitutales bacterium]